MRSYKGCSLGQSLNSAPKELIAPLLRAGEAVGLVWSGVSLSGSVLGLLQRPTRVCSVVVLCVFVCGALAAAAASGARRQSAWVRERFF